MITDTVHDAQRSLSSVDSRRIQCHPTLGTMADGLPPEDESPIMSEDSPKTTDQPTRFRSDRSLAWSRNYLKRFGLLENSSRGVWALTAAGLKSE